jgi:hypothetical protein
LVCAAGVFISENTPPPPHVIWGKIGKGQEKKGENASKKERKGKEKGKKRKRRK